MRNLKRYLFCALTLAIIVINLVSVNFKAYASGSCTRGTGDPCVKEVYDCYSGQTLYTKYDCGGTTTTGSEITNGDDEYDEIEQECSYEKPGYCLNLDTQEWEECLVTITSTEITCATGVDPSCSAYDCESEKEDD